MMFNLAASKVFNKVVTCSWPEVLLVKTSLNQSLSKAQISNQIFQKLLVVAQYRIKI
jgi:hypothetical protein